MRRIHVTTNTADDCNDALGGLGIAIDPDSGAILSPTRLTVGFDPAGITDDPCKPATKAGFLGADNQTFRVQSRRPDASSGAPTMRRRFIACRPSLSRNREVARPPFAASIF
jgi:hypothetical protein